MTALCQNDPVVPVFAPVYFDQNTGTIHHKWFPRLDSIGKYLSDNPEYQLQVHAFGHPTEENFYEIVFKRAENVLAYLTNKYEIKTHEHILINSNNRGVVPLEDAEYSERHKADTRKVEFIIEKKK